MIQTVKLANNSKSNKTKYVIIYLKEYIKLNTSLKTKLIEEKYDNNK